MKNKLFLMMLCAAVLAVSCNKDTEPEPVEEYDVTTGALILNNGNWGSNDANLALYDFNTGNVTENIFEKVNGTALGDLAQDILVYGTKAYIAVSNSGVIFVIDKKTCKSQGSIVEKKNDAPLSPRRMVARDGHIYVTYYEGYVGKIDTLTMEVEDLVKVGDNPEGITETGGYLYVANSGGLNYPEYGNTVSVIDRSSMHITNTLTVEVNPYYVIADSEGDVYVLSCGNYGDNPGGLQKIDTQTYEVMKIIGVNNPSCMVLGPGKKLYILTVQYDEEWNATKDILVYNADSYSERLAGKFITDGTTVPNAYSLSVDSVTGMLFIGDSDYVHTGSVYVYTKAGAFVSKLSTGGLNPQKTAFITEKQSI